MSDRIRLTVSITPATREVFTRLAQAAGTSLGRSIGDWLADTHEGAAFVASKMEEARQSPATVMRSFQALALGLHDEASGELERIRAASQSRPAPGAVRRTASGAGRAGVPPSGNTGGKSPTARSASPKTRGRP